MLGLCCHTRTLKPVKARARGICCVNDVRLASRNAHVRTRFMKFWSAHHYDRDPMDPRHGPAWVACRVRLNADRHFLQRSALACPARATHRATRLCRLHSSPAAWQSHCRTSVFRTAMVPLRTAAGGLTRTCQTPPRCGRSTRRGRRWTADRRRCRCCRSTGRREARWA